MLRGLLCIMSLTPLLAFAQDGGAEPDAGPRAELTDAGTPTVDGTAPPDAGRPTLAITELEANRLASEFTRALTDHLSTRMLASGRFDVVTQADITAAVLAEKQRVLLGAGQSERTVEAVVDALHFHYRVSGRVDRLGDHYLVAVTFTDATQNRVLQRVTRETSDATLLVQAVDEIADELLTPFGVPKKARSVLADRVEPRGANLGLKLGTQLVTGILRLQFGGDLELAYRLSLDWALFIQASFGLQLGASTTLAVVPGLLGVRKYFRAETSLQPYVSGGLGVLTTIDALQGKTRPSFVLAGGLQWLVTQRVGLTAEASIDLLGLLFGLGDTGSIRTVNLGLSLGLVYRF